MSRRAPRRRRAALAGPGRAPTGRLTLLLALALWVPRPAAAAGAVVVIEGARIATGDGPVLDSGTLVLDGDKVVAVGPKGTVKVPDGARRIDGTGLWVTPGLIDAESRAGLVEVSLEAATHEEGLDGRYDAVRAAFQVADGYNPESVVVPVTRLQGITTVLLAPEGGLVAGRGAAVDLDGQSADEALVRAPTALYMAFGAGARGVTFGARGGALLRLRELLDDVRQYGKRRQDYERAQMRHVVASRLDLEALLPVTEGKLPVVLQVQGAGDIRAALRFGKDEGLKIILSGCAEGWKVAGDIARAGVPCIVAPMTNLPESFDALDQRLDNAALLGKAGVKLVLSPRLGEPHNARTLRFEAGNAVANGLPWDNALLAVTRNPAEVFGIGERGLLAAGKLANVAVWSGDPFETTTRLRHLFVRGREIPLRSRQTELRDRYRDVSGMRPRP